MTESDKQRLIVVKAARKLQLAEAELREAKSWLAEALVALTELEYRETHSGGYNR